VAHRVAVVVTDGTHPFEFAVACEVFGLERPELRHDPYALRLCMTKGGVRLHGGLRVSDGDELRALAQADTVIVPHGQADGAPDAEIVGALLDAYTRGARLVSFCSGAFVLAATGLLDGRRATTHWMYAEAFRRRFPRVRLDPNVLFVDEGRLLTSAGTAAAIDLSLHLVRLDHGADVAQAIARRMVVPPHRDGGQAQFIAPAHHPRVDGSELAGLLDWLAENAHRDIPVAEMASRAAMSERTFARRFKEATGATPFRWLLGQRLRKAQALLETSDLDVEQVARRTGFGTGANLREHFRRELATTPTAYRRAFRGHGSTHAPHAVASAPVTRQPGAHAPPTRSPAHP
jgi:AraC family transcriptional regulator, transcriptional activator FtrA